MLAQIIVAITNIAGAEDIILTCCAMGQGTTRLQVSGYKLQAVLIPGL